MKKKLLAAEIAVLLILVAVAVFIRIGITDHTADAAEINNSQTENTENTEQPSESTEVFAPQPSETEATETEPKPEPTWMSFPEDRELAAQQYFVYDCDAGEFLAISGPEDERVYPASITKIFTAYVALQYLEPDTQITARDALELVALGSSTAKIDWGDVLTAEMLVEAMLLPSGNDAACILAVEIGRTLDGSSKEHASIAELTFVAEMNRHAQELGMTGTHFANPDGIHKEDHYSTLADLALMGKLALENETIMKYAGTSKDTVTFLSGEEKEWENTNALINPESEYYCPYAVGLKTGQTPYAGSCLLSAFQYEGRNLIIGVFGCAETEDRFADTLQLFNETMGFAYAEEE